MVYTHVFLYKLFKIMYVNVRVWVCVYVCVCLIRFELPCQMNGRRD